MGDGGSIVGWRASAPRADNPPTGPNAEAPAGADGKPPIGPDGMPGIGPPSAAAGPASGPGGGMPSGIDPGIGPGIAGIGPGIAPGPGLGRAPGANPGPPGCASAVPQLRQNFIPTGFSPRHTLHTTVPGNPWAGS
jgi:hypothetical protein